MSDTDKHVSEPVAADADFDVAVADAKPGEKNATRRGGTSVSWLALFLSLLAVAGSGYLLLDQWRNGTSAIDTDDALANLASRVDESSQSLSGLDDRITDLAAGVVADNSDKDAAIDTLRTDLEQRAQLFDSLPRRMSNIEQSVASLQGVSIDARNTYLIAEAEYYLQIANSQLQLAGNPYLASLALGQADDRLLQLADPALTDVRSTIADELAALEVMEKPDIAGVTLTLASLARVVESLPLRGAVQAEQASADNDHSALSGTAKAWAAVKGAALGLVKVTPPGADKTIMITTETADLARSNLSLQLQAARLALLRGEQEIFDQSLADADAWLERFFATDTEQVSSAQQTLAEMRDEYETVAAPDISQSLRLLRQYKTLAEPQQ